MFVSEYLKDFNATRAAKAAGYSPKTANEMGSQVLVNVSVASAVADGLRKRLTENAVTAERVIRELATNAFSDMRDLAV